MRFRDLSVLCVLLQGLVATIAAPGFAFEKRLTLEEISAQYTKRTPGGIHLPIVPVQNLMRRDDTSAIGLGDYADLQYTVIVTIGNTTFPLLLDTGSSDMWVISNACIEGCNASMAKPYSQGGLKPIVDVSLQYGDSSSNEFASGVIGIEYFQLAGIQLATQSFAVINRTNFDFLQQGISGIFGINFPLNSVIWTDLFVFLLDPSDDKVYNSANIPFPPDLSSTTVDGARRRVFPSIPAHLDASSTHSRLKTRQLSTSSEVDLALGTWTSMLSPPIPRVIASGLLPQPLIAITLQRDAIDIDSGTPGMLSIGEFPPGVESSALTWAPLRRYTVDEGGISGPSDSPFETYPLTWEIGIDSVYLDGVKLPETNLTPPFINITGLLDTGDPLIRGPADIITYINEQLGPNGVFDCANPHNLSFEIGGKLFPVDPRDLVYQEINDTVEFCRAKLTTTDTPKVGNFLFSWSLGVPFLKSVLSAYYFGNITHPSQDLPKIGLLSTVPVNAGDLLKAAVASASSVGTLPLTTQSAPNYSITLAPLPTPQPPPAE